MTTMWKTTHTLVFLLGVLHQPHEAQRFFIAAVSDTVRDLRFNHLSEDIDIIRDFDRSFIRLATASSG